MCFTYRNLMCSSIYPLNKLHVHVCTMLKLTRQRRHIAYLRLLFLHLVFVHISSFLRACLIFKVKTTCMHEEYKKRTLTGRGRLTALSETVVFSSLLGHASS